MKYTFFRINEIAGTYYTSGNKSKAIVIYAMGAPNVPDNGGLGVASYITKKGLDIFVPDYIGFGRTPGNFTPKNCIKTLLKLYGYLDKGTYGVNYYENKKKYFKYKRIVFIGKSLGATYVAVLPKFNKDIREISLWCGALDQSEQGKVKNEETNESFIDGLSKDFKFLYKGFNKKTWWDHVNDKDGLSPMDNLDCLKQVKVFIAHGMKDECIHYSKSLVYYNKLVNTYKMKRDNCHLKLYKNGDHGNLTTNKATRDFLKWIKL